MSERRTYTSCGFSPSVGSIVAVLEAYSDESEFKTGSPVLLIGGWVAHVDQWADLSDKWTSLLDQYGVPYFHTHTFKNARSRLYRHLGSRGRDQLLIGLLQLIKKFVMFGQVSWIKPKLYERLTTKELRGRHGSAYATAFGDTVSKIGSRVTDGGKRSETVSFFLEDGHRNASEAVGFVREYKTLSADYPPDVDVITYPGIHTVRQSPFKIGAVGLGDKVNMRPLQAADILAFCSLCQLKNSDDKFSKSILSAINVPVYKYEIDKADIVRTIELFKRMDAEDLLARRIRGKHGRELTKLGVKFKMLPDSIRVECEEGVYDKVREILGGELTIRDDP